MVPLILTQACSKSLTHCTGCVLELNYVLFLYNSGAADPGLKPSADFVEEKLYIFINKIAIT